MRKRDKFGLFPDQPGGEEHWLECLRSSSTLFHRPGVSIGGRLSLAPEATLKDAIQSGNVSGRVNQFFNTSAFVPAPLIHAGGLIDGQFPVAGDGTIFGSLGRNILRGPDQRNFDAALINSIRLREKLGIIFRWEVSTSSITRTLQIPRAMSRVRALSERSAL